MSRLVSVILYMLSSAIYIDSMFFILLSGVQLSFRTRMEEGLILCALSPGEQEEFVALQMRNGRPYFLFDPQVGYSSSSLCWNPVLMF